MSEKKAIDIVREVIEEIHNNIFVNNKNVIVSSYDKKVLQIGTIFSKNGRLVIVKRGIALVDFGSDKIIYLSDENASNVIPFNSTEEYLFQQSLLADVLTLREVQMLIELKNYANGVHDDI